MIHTVSIHRIHRCTPLSSPCPRPGRPRPRPPPSKTQHPPTAHSVFHSQASHVPVAAEISRAMVQRVTYRRRKSFRTASNVVRKVSSSRYAGRGAPSALSAPRRAPLRRTIFWGTGSSFSDERAPALACPWRSFGTHGSDHHAAPRTPVCFRSRPRVARSCCITWARRATARSAATARASCLGCASPDARPPYCSLPPPPAGACGCSPDVLPLSPLARRPTSRHHRRRRPVLLTSWLAASSRVHRSPRCARPSTSASASGRRTCRARTAARGAASACASALCVPS
jgi:hypothetical protein